MNNETILTAAISGGSVGSIFMYLFKRFMSKTDEAIKTVGKNSERIAVLETTAITSKQLDETIDRTIVPIREDITQFNTTFTKKLDDTMDELKAMKTDHIIEARAKAMANQMVKDQST